MQSAAHTPRNEPDRRVVFHEVDWPQFQALLATRGNHPRPRVAYLDGELELMSPSREHERVASLLGRLIEAYAQHERIELDAFGSWLLEDAGARRGVEPDECYVLGGADNRVPDLAIEVGWTSGGLSKLDIYRGLGIGEVWFWKQGSLAVYRLGPDGYARHDRSAVLPDLDVSLLARFLDHDSQLRAVEEFLAAVRGG